MIAAAVRQRVDEGVDEGLIVETDFAAGGIAGVVALEGAETVDQPIGLRAVVVREHRQIRAEDDGAVHRRHCRRQSTSAGDRHGLGAAGELPEQSRCRRPRRPLGLGAAAGVSVFVNSTR